MHIWLRMHNLHKIKIWVVNKIYEQSKKKCFLVYESFLALISIFDKLLYVFVRLWYTCDLFMYLSIWIWFFPQISCKTSYKNLNICHKYSIESKYVCKICNVNSPMILFVQALSILYSIDYCIFISNNFVRLLFWFLCFAFLLISSVIYIIIPHMNMASADHCIFLTIFHFRNVVFQK